MLSNTDIDKLMRSDPFIAKIYVGTVARDQLPSIIVQRPSLYVVNTDPSNLPGQHWFVVYFVTTPNDQTNTVLKTTAHLKFPSLNLKRKRSRYSSSSSSRSVSKKSSRKQQQQQQQKHFQTLFAQTPVFNFNKQPQQLTKTLNEHFDSSGYPPSEDIKSILISNGPNYMYNSNRVQSFTSETCGYFCIMYAYYRARGISFPKFLSMFSKNVSLNEALIKYFFKVNF